MRPTKADKARVRGYVEEWQKLLFLNAYAIDLLFSDSPEKDEPATRASMSSNHPYLNFSITLYPTFWAEPHDEQHRSVVHEMVHELTRHLRGCSWKLLAGKFVNWSEVIDADERAVDHIATALFCLQQLKSKR